MTPSKHAFAEAERLRRQGEIDGGRSAAARNAMGQFATPAALADDIVRYLEHHMLDGRTVHFADPAIGSGSFYSALLRALPAKRIASAIGVEIDSAFAAAAKETWGAFGLQVVEGDFTDPFTRASLPRPDLVIANPPYVRHHHLPAAKKRALQMTVERETNIKVSGLAGLYVYFLILATEWMKDDGVAAWLIPSEFMDVNYGAALRRYLSTTVELLRVHRYDPHDVQFADALVSSAVVVFRKARPPADSKARMTFGGALDSPALTEVVALSTLGQESKWMRYPRITIPEEREDGPALRIGDLFRIRRGIATGANEFFILPRATAQAHGIPDGFLRPILPSPRRLPQRVVERAPDGYPQLDEQLALIDCDLPEAIVQEQHPALWQYFGAAPPEVRQRYLVAKRTPWYRQEQRLPAPFLCTYMGRGGRDDPRPVRFIWNKSEAVATNMYLMLYPTPLLEQAMIGTEEALAEVHRLLLEITGDELRRGGRVYGGGLHKMEPGELADLPADAFVAALPGLAEEVAARGAQLVILP